jgi:fatty-acyl-CoA synthase
VIVDIPDLLAKRAALSADRVAFEDAATGRTLTYAELNDHAGRAASLLAARGVGRGDRVAILTRNRIEFFELLFGCAKLGAILVPLNWRMPPAELDGLIADAGPVLLVHGTEEEAAAAGLAMPLPALHLDRYYAAARDAAPAGSWRSLRAPAATW